MNEILLLPLHAMAENFGLVCKSLRPKLGHRSYFTAEGKVALMFLKMYMDATCYESEMRYPTDPKLLWEGIEKSYETMCELSKRLRIHRPRTKFIDVKKANLTYRKQRRHSKSKASKMYRQQKNHFQSTVGGLLKRNYAHRKVLSRGNYASVIENGQKIRPKRPE